MKTYLGDSVYAETDRGMLRLFLDNGDGAKSNIYLEPVVFAALKLFVEQLPPGAFQLQPTEEEEQKQFDAEEEEELKGIIERYGRHLIECATNFGGVCDCELAEVSAKRGLNIQETTG